MGREFCSEFVCGRRYSSYFKTTAVDTYQVIPSWHKASSPGKEDIFVQSVCEELADFFTLPSVSNRLPSTCILITECAFGSVGGVVHNVLSVNVMVPVMSISFGPLKNTWCASDLLDTVTWRKLSLPGYTVYVYFLHAGIQALLPK